MMRRQWLAAATMVVALTSEVPAQVILVPAPVFVAGPVVFVPSGIGHHRRHHSISGLYGIHGYGAFDSRVTVYVIGSNVILGRRPVFPQEEVDLRGVDLDVVGPEALQPGGKPDLARIPVPPPNKRPLDKVEVAKQVEVPGKPPKIVDVPKKEVPAPPPPQPKVGEKPAGLPEPKAEPLEENRRLTDLGLIAFGNRAYGLAALRFRQAAEVEPVQPRPYFLISQAYLALGKYKDAVAAIEAGMRRQPDWPLSAFQPRVDLYKGIEDDWFAHKKQLTDVQTLHPDQPAYLFLEAYAWWFDEQRDQATEMFGRAKALAPDNAFIDAFLKVAPKLAAN